MSRGNLSFKGHDDALMSWMGYLRKWWGRGRGTAPSLARKGGEDLTGKVTAGLTLNQWERARSKWVGHRPQVGGQQEQRLFPAA